MKKIYQSGKVLSKKRYLILRYVSADHVHLKDADGNPADAKAKFRSTGGFAVKSGPVWNLCVTEDTNDPVTTEHLLAAFIDFFRQMKETPPDTDGFIVGRLRSRYVEWPLVDDYLSIMLKDTDCDLVIRDL